MTAAAGGARPARGRFITFEGGEGTGKSTQAALLAESLRKSGREVVLTREPGGSPFAEHVRGLILSAKTPPHDALSEALLFYAARADHLAATIRPALAAGRWVISDRFSDSTRVYQGHAGGIGLPSVEALEKLVVAPTAPDLTVILDLPADVGLARAAKRHTAGMPEGGPAERDPYEERALAFHQRLRDGFLDIARREPQRCVVIDAGAAVEEIAAAVWAAVEGRLLVERH